MPCCKNSKDTRSLTRTYTPDSTLFSTGPISPQTRFGSHSWISAYIPPVSSSTGVRTCPDFYIGGKPQQPLYNNSTGVRRSAVHLDPKDRGHSFEDGSVRFLAREDRWGLKEERRKSSTSTWRNQVDSAVSPSS